MTTVSAVLAGLATLGASTLPTSQVINGPPGSVTTTTGRLLIVGDGEDAVDGDAQSDSITDGIISEQYRVHLAVSVDLAGTDQTAADALALADYDAMTQAIRRYPGGPNLGLAGQGVLLVLPTGAFTMRRVATENGRSTAIRFPVIVHAHHS